MIMTPYTTILILFDIYDAMEKCQTWTENTGDVQGGDTRIEAVWADCIIGTLHLERHPVIRPTLEQSKYIIWACTYGRLWSLTIMQCDVINARDHYDYGGNQHQYPVAYQFRLNMLSLDGK